MDTLVTPDWLHARLDEPDLVVLDCTVITEDTASGGMRNVSGRAAYDQGHIPGAGFADLTNELCDRDSPIEFDLPTPDRFAAAMGALGVGDGSRVVLYDANQTSWAARVWWMLRWIGFDRAAILDGGLRAWTAVGFDLSRESVTRAAARLTPAPRPELIADRDEVRAAIDDPDVRLIDTLPAPFYRGELTIYARPGHIPGAVNVSGLDLLDEDGRYRPMSELAAQFGDTHDKRTITYCGGGILASSSAFVMTRLGFEDVAVYTASLQEWAADPANPLVVEEDVSPAVS